MQKERKKILWPLIVLVILELIIYTILKYGFSNSDLANTVNFYSYPLNLAVIVFYFYLSGKKK